MIKELYPLLLKPFSTNAGGAGKIGGFLQTEIEQDSGVCYSLLDSEGTSNKIVNGPLKDQTLADIIKEFPVKLLGQKNKSNTFFPITIRLLETSKHGRICVHPKSKTIIGSTEYNTNTRFWYNLDADKNAEIIAGLKHKTTMVQVRGNLKKGKISHLTQCYKPRYGDSFYIPPGRVYGISAGNFVLEIAQNTEEPIPVSCWNNSQAIDPDQLQATIDNINFWERQVGRIPYDCTPNRQSRKLPFTLYNCPFNVDEIRVIDPISDSTNIDNFHILIPVKNSINVFVNKHTEVKVRQGYSLVIPASCGAYRVQAVDEYANYLKIRNG